MAYIILALQSLSVSLFKPSVLYVRVSVVRMRRKSSHPRMWDANQKGPSPLCQDHKPSTVESLDTTGGSHPNKGTGPCDFTIHEVRKVETQKTWLPFENRPLPPLPFHLLEITAHESLISTHRA
jgi:hypothetical protein